MRYSPERVYSDLENLTRATITGKMGLLVTGTPGSGKSKTISDVIGSMVRENRVTVIKGYSTARDLWDKMVGAWIHKNVLVYDDCDSILKDKTAVNLLKGFLDTDTTWVSYGAKLPKVYDPIEEMKPYYEFLDGCDISPRDMDYGRTQYLEILLEAGRYPSRIKREAAFIMISNLTVDDINPAIVSRTNCIDVSPSPEHMMRRIGCFIDKLEEYPRRYEVFEFFRGNLAKYPSMSLRIFMKALNMSNVSEDWISMIPFMTMSE